MAYKHGVYVSEVATSLIRQSILTQGCLSSLVLHLYIWQLNRLTQTNLFYAIPTQKQLLHLAIATIGIPILCAKS